MDGEGGLGERDQSMISSRCWTAGPRGDRANVPAELTTSKSSKVTTPNGALRA